MTWRTEANSKRCVNRHLVSVSIHTFGNISLPKSLRPNAQWRNVEKVRYRMSVSCTSILKRQDAVNRPSFSCVAPVVAPADAKRPLCLGAQKPFYRILMLVPETGLEPVRGCPQRFLRANVLCASDSYIVTLGFTMDNVHTTLWPIWHLTDCQ